MPKIHPTAIVDPSAEIHDGVAVGPWSVIGPRCVIGAETEVRSHVVIGQNTTLGRGNVIHPFALVGGDPQDLKYHGEETQLVIGDRNQIREHTSIHRGTANGGGVTRIGSDNLLMAVSHVAHDCVIGDGTVIANNVMIAGHVHVEDFASIGGGAGIHHFARVGTCAFVGAMARCSKDVPPFMVVEGNPAEVRKHNDVLMRRRGYTEEDVEAMRDAFKLLFMKRGGGMLDKVTMLREAHPRSRPVELLCAMVLESGAGVNGRALENRRTDDKRAVRVGAPQASASRSGASGMERS
ncbi:MAG: acyl-ACP--UDP-N-acetylglucosamine O-acyltransferase [Phycisphaeraceae bacterium]|nr:acyl-ACP--UDP-N-acetylglucosamine O-acyltransferase [Phycisphaeraceae bacterium]